MSPLSPSPLLLLLLLLVTLFLLVGSLFLLLLGLQMNTKMEQQMQLLSKFVDKKWQQHNGRMIVLTTDKEFWEILSATIKIKMENVPKFTQLLDEKRRQRRSPIDGNGGTNGGGKIVGEIGAICNGSSRRGKSSESCPLPIEHSQNWTTTQNAKKILSSFNFGVTLWHFMALQSVAWFTVSFAIALLAFLTVTLRTGKMGGASNEENNAGSDGTATDDAVGDVSASDGAAAQCFQNEHHQLDEPIPLEASIWWHYLSTAPTASNDEQQHAKSDAESAASKRRPKASILKKRPSKKSLDTPKVQNAIGTMNTNRFVNNINSSAPRPNKDVHFVGRSAEEQTNKLIHLQKGSRFSSKENYLESFGENAARVICILRHPPDKKGMPGEQFGESLEEKMAKIIAAAAEATAANPAARTPVDRYSNRADSVGYGDGYRRRKSKGGSSGKWLLRWLGSVEKRRMNKTVVPMYAVPALNKQQWSVGDEPPQSSPFV